MNLLYIALPTLITVLVIIIPLIFRRIVDTNEVHIIQSANKTKSYGKSTANGNVYYEWPTWVPKVGISKIILPVNNFQLQLQNYNAYDKDRVPFVVDIVAFFRISDSNLAAERIASFEQLQEQLTLILRGAVRSLLASAHIDEIMLNRAEFGIKFTDAVKEQLTQWGVETVKAIELMDVRDETGSQVIHNIMAKRKSAIESESRKEVAKNMKEAQTAEIEATREVQVNAQMAEQSIGEKTAQKEKAIGIAREIAKQEITEQARLTKEKDMAIIQVQTVRQAEITKSANVVKAEENKQVLVVQAEGEKQRTITIAEGKLEEAKRNAEGVQVEGLAKAEAEKAMQLAPVQAQITLAQEIGSNEKYQEYLITIRAVEANQAVGIKQAEALKEAEIKVIANTGNPVEGVKNVMDLFSSKGGTDIGAMLEGLAQTDQGKTLLSKFTLKK